MIHPAITLLAIVATANHYWLDAAIAGVLVVAAAALLGARRERQLEVAVPALAIPHHSWSPVGTTWSSSLASNDPPLAIAATDAWLADFEAGRFEATRMNRYRTDTERVDAVGEMMLLDRCT